MTILDKDADGVIRILIESEDHLMRAIYPVILGKDNTASDSASDASMDYDYRNMTLRAPSEEAAVLLQKRQMERPVPSGIQTGEKEVDRQTFEMIRITVICRLN